MHHGWNAGDMENLRSDQRMMFGPDDTAHDPYGYVCNQADHKALAGVGLAQLYTRGSITRMNVADTPAGANHDVTSFPAPRVDAETVNLWVVNAAGSVTIKASSTVPSDVVVPTLGKVTMVAFNRQWVRLT